MVANRLNGMAPTPAVVREDVSAVELVYQELETHLEQTSNSNWETGQLFERLHEMGQTDEAISKRTGVSHQQVNQIRRICLAFADRFAKAKKKPVLSFTHYGAAMAWEDKDKWLDLAEKHKLPVRQMVAERDAAYKPVEPVTDAALEEYEDVEPPQAAAVDEAFAEEPEEPEDEAVAAIVADPIDLALANAIAVKQIRAKLGELVKLIECADAMVPGFEKLGKSRRAVLRALDQVKHSLSCSIPDCRCTRCNGERCNYCDNLGWIDAHTKRNWLENR